MRKYSLTPSNSGEIIPVALWLKGLNENYLDESEGQAYWMKDDKESDSNAFLTDPLDATHVAWYPNYIRTKNATYILIPINKLNGRISEIDVIDLNAVNEKKSFILKTEKNILIELLNNSKRISLNKKDMQRKALNQFPNLDVENNEYDKGRYLGYKQAIKDLLDLL